MNIMDSKELCLGIEEEVKNFSKSCIIRPSVAVITIGEELVNDKFVKEREEACNKAGIYFRYYNFEDNTPELTIINKIKELNNDEYVNGIMVDLPMPEKYNEKRVLNSIINSKDIDGLTDINIGRLISGRKSITPCKVQAIMELLKTYEVDLEGKEVTIIGNSKLVGKPLINILLNMGSTVTICTEKTLDIKKHIINSDIIISCINSKGLIQDDMINEGVIAIDAGYTIEGNKIYGDFDTKASKKASLYAPVESIENLTVSMILKNTIFCYSNKK